MPSGTMVETQCVILLLLSVALSDGSEAILPPSLVYKPELNAG